jgi:hypothetical protein
MSVKSDKHPGDLHQTERVRNSKLIRFSIHVMAGFLTTTVRPFQLFENEA